MRPRRSRKDLSKISGNSTSALQDAYPMLMSIKDPQELYEAAIAVVKPLLGRGISEKNYNQFEKTLSAAARKGIVAIQFYISRYILNGSGMGVESNNIKAMASMISEDIDNIPVLTREQYQLKQLIESNSCYKVVLLEQGTVHKGAELVGYSTPAEGYCVHDETGVTWGRHPQNYNGPLLFIKDSAGMVTAVGMEVTPEQKNALQEHTLPWDGEIPYDEAVVSGDNVMEVITKIGFDHEDREV